MPLYKVDAIQKYIISNGIYFNEDILYWITSVFQNGIIGKRIKNGNVLDIGSNIGNHSLYFALECGAKNVKAFEPIKDTYNTLCRNVEINNLENIINTYNVAVGENESRGISLGTYERNTGGTSIAEADLDAAEQFPIISVDSLELDRCDFMKIDVENFEKHVIEGALNTIKSHHPYIMLESFETL